MARLPPPSREGVCLGSPTLQTLQDPILLLPWVWSILTTAWWHPAGGGTLLGEWTRHAQPALTLRLARGGPGVEVCASACCLAGMADRGGRCATHDLRVVCFYIRAYQRAAGVDTAVQKLRSGRVGFGTGRQKRVLERGTNPQLSRRTCSPRYGVPSCRSKSAGVV